jgi:ubiquinone/menaquinone biosynthesis C-methylase UbiE
VTLRLDDLLEEAIARSHTRKLQRYLDDCRSITAVRRNKRRGLALLGTAPGARVLDLGCGTGEDVQSLATAAGSRGCAVGVDADPGMARTAADRSGGSGAAARFLAAAGARLPFRDGTFDGCRAERVLVHAPDPGAIVAELVRVTRDGGRVVLSEPDWYTLVVHGVDAESSERLVARVAERFTSPRVGRALGAMLRAGGASDVRVVGAVATFDRLAAADRVLGLSAAIAEAARDGAGAAGPGANAAHGWWAQLEAADARGDFLAAMTGFHAVGRAGNDARVRRPASPRRAMAGRSEPKGQGARLPADGSTRNATP